MHFSLVSSALALTLSTFTSSILAAAVEKGALVRREYSSSATISYCTLDNVLGPLSEYVPDGPDATSFCSGFIGITDSTECWTTVMPSTTVYVATVYDTTVTSPTTTYDATVTATATETVIGLKRKRDADVAARAAVTPIVERAQLQARDFNTSAFVDYIIPALSSACTCLHVTPGVVYTTCTASTSTRTEDEVATVTSTVFTPVDGGTTTVTVTVNSTSHILPSSLVLNTTSSSWVVPSSTSSWTTTSLPSGCYIGKKGVTHCPSTSTGSSTTTSSWSYSSETTSTTSSASASSTSAVPTPTECPGLHGQTFSSSLTCKLYQYQCVAVYPASDFYNEAGQYASIEECAHDVCDPDNAPGGTPCLGVQWSAVDGACSRLQSLANPAYNPSSLAAILVGSNATNCTNATVLPTSMISTVTSSTSKSHRRSHGTGAGSSGWPSHTSNGTYSWGRTGYSTGIPTGPTNTTNSTCPVSTATTTTSVLVTMFMTDTITLAANGTCPPPAVSTACHTGPKGQVDCSTVAVSSSAPPLSPETIFYTKTETSVYTATSTTVVTTEVVVGATPTATVTKRGAMAWFGW